MLFNPQSKCLPSFIWTRFALLSGIISKYSSSATVPVFRGMHIDPFVVLSSTAGFPPQKFSGKKIHQKAGNNRLYEICKSLWKKNACWKLHVALHHRNNVINLRLGLSWSIVELYSVIHQDSLEPQTTPLFKTDTY